MTLFAMQVACSCDNNPSGMVMLTSWDGQQDCEKGFVPGRRYLWECQLCKIIICVNMKEMEVER